MKNIYATLSIFIIFFIACNPVEKVDFRQLFAYWANIKNDNDGDLCTDKKCKENLESSKNGADPIHDCFMRINPILPKEQILLGDLNNDGLEDAIVKYRYEKCVDIETSASMLFNVISSNRVLAFISKTDGYDIKEKVDVFNKHLGKGHLTHIENGLIFGKGLGNSGDEDVAHWENDIEWTAQFKFENGKFVLVSKTKSKKK